MREIKLIGCACIIILLGFCSHALAGDDPDLVIVPGEAVGRLKIGDKRVPAASTRVPGLAIERAGDGTIKKIKVTGGQYSVQYNRLHVGDGLQKIFRFYDPITKETKGKDLLIIRAPRQGIEFSVDVKKEIITEIGIFEPEIPDYYQRKTQQQKNVEQKSGTQDQETLKKYYQDVLKK